jgi:hypothetical protein
VGAPAAAVEVVNRLVVNKAGGVVRSLTADKNYFAIEEIARIQELNIRTVIGDPNAARRRKAALDARLRKALHRAACAVRSASGKALLRQRGMHLERSFEHVLDEGGLRRATLKGTDNLAKRHKIAATCFNLSLLMRTLVGVGTPKQWIAGASTWLKALLAYLCQGFRVSVNLTPRPRFPLPVLPNLFRTQRALHETTGFFNSLNRRRTVSVKAITLSASVRGSMTISSITEVELGSSKNRSEVVAAFARR